MSDVELGLQDRSAPSDPAAANPTLNIACNTASVRFRVDGPSGPTRNCGGLAQARGPGQRWRTRRGRGDRRRRDRRARRRHGSQIQTSTTSFGSAGCRLLRTRPGDNLPRSSGSVAAVSTYGVAASMIGSPTSTPDDPLVLRNHPYRHVAEIERLLVQRGGHLGVITWSAIAARPPRTGRLRGQRLPAGNGPHAGAGLLVVLDQREMPTQLDHRGAASPLSLNARRIAWRRWLRRQRTWPRAWERASERTSAAR